MKCLVTGAGGFIGTHLVRALVERGDRVTCLVRRPPADGQLPTLGVDLAFGDLTDRAGSNSLPGPFDVVYHLAGLTKAFGLEELLAVNERGTRNLASACAMRAAPPVFVQVSSLAAAGPVANGCIRTEQDAPAPISNYGRSKLAGEQAAREFAADLPLTIVRPSIVFGERDAGMFSLFQMINNLGLHLAPGLRPREYSLIHAADLVQLLLLAAEKGARVPARGDAGRPSSGVYYAADSQRLTYAEMGRTIARAIGRPRLWVQPLPELAGWGVAAASEVLSRLRRRASLVSFDKMREAAAGSWVCSNERAERELGFRPARSLEVRFAQTAQWYIEAGWLKQRWPQPAAAG